MHLGKLGDLFRHLRTMKKMLVDIYVLYDTSLGAFPRVEKKWKSVVTSLKVFSLKLIVIWAFRFHGFLSAALEYSGLREFERMEGKLANEVCFR